MFVASKAGLFDQQAGNLCAIKFVAQQRAFRRFWLEGVMHIPRYNCG
jgi:hypothetical protein